ncbi:hypothetical protein M7I_1596 [Glarea lozoyensis 74030]|uniref:Uncharacterized protein n=1 Tax=Glarea lozoyensis (strain ATCC 74030 / MF5533) TaxID=1104152 RepID=H0EGI0_GLAL7|nr:hypothetical protein M7I_1596 [Glarea lozoyensis 74030]
MVDTSTIQSGARYRVVAGFDLEGFDVYGCEFGVDGAERESGLGKLGNEIVKIYAGPSSHLIIVHHAILCAKIPLFVDVFAKWEGGADPYMMFPHDDATAFEVLIEWSLEKRLASSHGTVVVGEAYFWRHRLE